MTFQIEFREAIMIVLALAGAYFFMVKALTTQFKKANDAQLTDLKDAIKSVEKRSDGHIDGLRTAINALDGDVRRLQADMPKEYVRKEDYTAQMGTVYAKIDTVAAMQQTLILMVGKLDGAKDK